MSTNSFSDPSTPPLDPALQSDTSSSTTGSPLPSNLQRLNIHLNMGDHAYMKSRTIPLAHISDGLLTETTLPESGASHTPPCSSAFGGGELQSYTTIAPYSSYSIPSYDSSSLPTPVSVAGSPSIPEGTTKHMQSYGQQRTRSSQQPTPPGTSQSEWTNQHIGMQSSQSGSPLPLQHANNDVLEMQGIESTHSPPQDQGPPMVSEANWDWGHYGVSCTEPQADMSPQLAQQQHPIYPVDVTPSALVRPNMGMNPHIPLAPAGTPVHSMQHSPDPRHLGHQVGPMGPMGHQFPHHHMAHHQPPPVLMEFVPASRSKRHMQKSRAGRNAKRGNRVSKSSYRDYESSPQFSGGALTPDQNRPRPQGEQITLKDDAPEPDRFLFDLRNQMLDNKGKGMWEALQAAYSDRYGPKERPALQMQLSRAIMKYGLWPESEDDALRKAVSEANKQYYSNVAKLMKEFGGCRAWDFGDLHIAQRMLELGLEEFDPQEPSKRVRKKQKSTPRRGPALAGPGSGPWNSQHPYGAGGNNPNNGERVLSNEQEDRLVQLFCKPEAETPEPEENTSPSSQNGIDGIKTDQEPGRADSARVAKRACAQLFNRADSNPVYGNLPSESRHPMP